MTKYDVDMERLGRIDRILLAAIDRESTTTAGGLQHLKSNNVISRALAGIRREADLGDLCNLLVIDATLLEAGSGAELFPIDISRINAKLSKACRGLVSQHAKLEIMSGTSSPQ